MSRKVRQRIGNGKWGEEDEKPKMPKANSEAKTTRRKKSEKRTATPSEKVSVPRKQEE